MLKLIPFLLAFVACSSPHPTLEPPITPQGHALDEGKVGVLVMAHGGDAAWNRSVAAAVAPLAATIPTAVAYGMANPKTLSAGLDSLRVQGVGRVAVVRLFISGQSFRDQTDYLLGLSKTPPERFVLMGASDPESRPEPLRHGLTIATHDHGLMVSPHARRILRERATDISSTPGKESVLILAHGMGLEHENDRVLDATRSAARHMRDVGFATIRVATLREDWEEERKTSERQVRDFLRQESSLGRHALVLPMRLSGFGPYAEVLEGLDYTAGRGLLPHPEIANWIQVTATLVACEAGWEDGAGPCPRPVIQSSNGSR